MRYLNDTPEWRLGAWLDWRPIPQAVTCDHCGGNKTVGGGLGDLDGPRECSNCMGMGFVHVQPKSQKPEIPQDLRQHMAKAWYDFNSNPKNALENQMSAEQFKPEASKQFLNETASRAYWHALLDHFGLEEMMQRCKITTTDMPEGKLIVITTNLEGIETK